MDELRELSKSINIMAGTTEQSAEAIKELKNALSSLKKELAKIAIRRKFDKKVYRKTLLINLFSIGLTYMQRRRLKLISKN